MQEIGGKQHFDESKVSINSTVGFQQFDEFSVVINLIIR